MQPCPINPLTGLATLAFAASLFIVAEDTSAALIGSDMSGNLYNVDTTTGGTTLIGNTGISLLAALEFAPDNTLYGFSVDPGNLYTINPSNASVTNIGGFTADFEGGLAISPAGSAWGTNIGFDENSQLFTLDLSNANSNNLGTIGNGNHDFNGLVWRSDGKLVGLDRVTSSLLAIDLNNLSTTIVASTVSGTPVGGLTTTDYETGFLAIGTDLYTVDLFTGAQSLVGDTGVRLSALAEPVPIPAAAWLFGSGMVGLVGMARRKRTKA